MDWLWTLCTIAHIFGVALAVGCATAKVVLLLKCRKDRSFVPIFLSVAPPLTKLLVFGLVVLTLSGIGWLLLGYPLTPVLILKLVLVGGMWVVGPVIDKVAEPKFREQAANAVGPVSREYAQSWQLFLRLEVAATGLFYVIVLVWLIGSQI